MSLLPGDTEQHPETFLMVTTRMGEGCYRHLVGKDKDAAKHPTVHRMPTGQAGLAPGVSSAEVGLTNYLDLSVLFFLLAVPGGSWDLSSLTRD